MKKKILFTLALCVITLVILTASNRIPQYSSSSRPLTIDIAATVKPPAPVITFPLPTDNFSSTDQNLAIEGSGYPLGTVYIQENGITICQTQASMGTIPDGGSFSCIPPVPYSLGAHTFDVFIRYAGAESDHTPVIG
ncbi:MAG: hypothetical protein WCP97_07325, partial [bacterium]